VSATAPVWAVIPARGGSKGIPRKNIRPLAGRPLLVHSIEAALEAPAVDRVVVSTDDREIASVAEHHGAEVVWRPAEISGDAASSESALLHALDSAQDREGHDPDLVVFLQATSPLRRPGDVQRAIDLLRSENADSLFSAFRPSGFLWRVANGDLSPVNYDPANRPRRQELTEEIVIENGSIYVFKPWVLRQTGSRLGGRIVAYMMGALHSFELDEPDDWDLLERLSTLRETAQGDRP
jgi:CMP-N,N'-diacetyllegionaminic acid synthase